MTFPTNPTQGDIYTAENGLKFIWDGEKWTSYFQGVSSADLTIGGNLVVKNGSPVLILQDTNSTGAEQLGYISLRDNTDTEKGWIGFGTTGNNILNISNSYGTITANGNVIDTYTSNSEATSLNAGVWYTIAVNPGDRASAKFTLTDKSSGNHQSVIFHASHFYGAGNNIDVLHNNYYGGSPYQKLRIKEGGTYDGAMLQVYIDLNPQAVQCYMFENLQSNGWMLKNWIPDGIDPGNLNSFGALNTIAVEVDLDILNKGNYSNQYTAIYTEGLGYVDQDTTKSPFYTFKTLSGSQYSPIAKSRVTGATRNRTISFGALHNNNGTIDAVIHGIDDSDVNNYAWNFTNSGDFISPGNVTAYSDIRLKTDISPIQDSLTKIQNLNGVNFKFKSKDPDKVQLGLIAQDVLKILPEVVTESADEEKTLSIAYGNIVALLIEGIKELNNEVKLLKKEIDTLKSIK